GIIFHGTESLQALAAAAPWLDEDGDGIPTGFAGADCDDGDAAVHPLMFEVPGNGKDDNCRLGDRVPGSTAPVEVERTALPSPGAAAWRAAHPLPDVVLVFVDTLRADAVDALRPRGAPPLGTTPHIDRLAASGVVFTQARTTAPRTPHAWMSLIRGRFLGRTLACRQRLRDPQGDTLVHALSDAGYHTRARLVGKSWRRFHLHEGWETLVEGGHVGRINGPAATRDAQRLLAEPGEPLFLVVHYADAHAPYLPHPGVEPASDSLVDRYRGEVRAVDAEVGRLLASIAARGRPTVVVLFADHGENLGDHGQKGGHHGVSVYDEVVRVPLIISAPDVAPRRVEDPVSLVDLAPTVLELTGASGLPGADGRSLARHLFGEPIAAAPTVSEFYDFGLTLRAVVDGRYKLVRDVRRGSVRLFDVVADPGELVDLTGEEPDVAARLGAWLDAWIEYRVDPSERRAERCKTLVPE
ncbi:MAG: sulfatase-like hydrolase/transferase, partial [Myxococcales bacterium]|nr:sulfatase-like hydrolase/transferase [Myxococcales bacterium]